ncbi:MAG: class I SAM-dependent methyltransferase [Bacteroidia bacterium]|nr:class I SAM-dependent methyltransferase [Bacteroidia bacterium]
MNEHLLNTKVQNFINSNLESDVTALYLKKLTFKNVPYAKVLEQLESKQRCKKKLPTWFNTPNIIYPNKLNIEQTSSEVTAAYKADLLEGETLIDMTGGFGVDVFYFSKRFKKVTHCEIDEDLSTSVSHNFKELHVTNVDFVIGDGLNYLKHASNRYDWLYVDPSRRHEEKGKVFLLSHCLPDLPTHLNTYFNYSDNILAKVSPMLDISQALSELSQVREIHIIALKNEVKELLFVMSKKYSGPIKILSINFTSNGQQLFSFMQQEEKQATANYSDIQSYLYEPNSALLKSGAFQLVSETLKLNKLHKHSHLYTSENFIDFPGRTFKVNKVIPFSKKILKKEIYKAQINISTRNFPQSVKSLKKKFKIKDGGPVYAFFTTNLNDEKVVILTERHKKRAV